MREKVSFVVDENERRLGLLGFTGGTPSRRRPTLCGTSIPSSATRSSARGAQAGIIWTYARPPVKGLDYEMDVRGPARELAMP